MSTHRRHIAPAALSRRAVLIVGVLLVFVTALILGLLATGRSQPWSLLPVDQSRVGTEPSYVVLAPRHAAPAAERTKQRPAPQRALGRWARVLRRLDHRRGQAWRHGRPHQLRAVFAPGAALRQDSVALRGYARRGLTVSGVRMAFHRVHMVQRTRGEVDLLVVDQLTGAVAHGRDAWAARLPHDQPSRHLITLAATHGGWRIRGVVAAAG